MSALVRRSSSWMKGLSLLAGVTATGVAVPALAAPAKPAPPKRAPAPPPAPKPASIEIQPGTVALNGPRSEQRLLVTGHFADGTARDVTADARWTLAKPGIAALDAEAVALR